MMIDGTHKMMLMIDDDELVMFWIILNTHRDDCGLTCVLRRKKERIGGAVHPTSAQKAGSCWALLPWHCFCSSAQQTGDDCVEFMFQTFIEHLLNKKK